MNILLIGALIILVFAYLTVILYIIMFGRFLSTTKTRLQSKQLIGTSFYYDYTRQNVYFTVKPWFLNQRHNSVKILNQLLTKNSALNFKAFLAKLVKINKKPTMQSPLSIIISFYIRNRVEKCQLSVFKLNQKQTTAIGVLTNFYAK